MNERRYDPTSDTWVTVSAGRQDRTFLPPTEGCPLCPTRPAGEPTEVPRASFEVVVFDNRFPALSPTPPAVGAGDELFAVAPAAGRCEVVVYTDDHHATLADLGEERIRLLIDVWADRTELLGGEPDVTYVMPFENRGEVVGATLEHPHGQIYAYPEIPERVRTKLAAASRHRDATGRCVRCDVVERERASGDRVVVDAGTVVAHVPFAPRFPYEVHVVPVEHRTDLTALSDAERNDLARAIQQLAERYDDLFGFPLPYVMAVHQAPTDDGTWDDVAHLHLEFTPFHRAADRLKFLAGSELAAGAFLVDRIPEATAAELRGAGS